MQKALELEGVSGYDKTLATRMIGERSVNSFITRLGADAWFLAEENNGLQEIAEATRLGIPATISTDPRNHFQFTLGASVAAGRFSQWPEVLGFAAIGDADVLTGKAAPQGKLPFELPSSMSEVEAQRSDMPHDTAHPLYPLFFGLGY